MCWAGLRQCIRSINVSEKNHLDRVVRCDCVGAASRWACETSGSKTKSGGSETGGSMDEEDTMGRAGSQRRLAAAVGRGGPRFGGLCRYPLHACLEGEVRL